MNADNMTRWEGSLTASERRVLTTAFVGRAMASIMDNSRDNMCVGCFERTGLLLTMLATVEYDSKIKPQGMKIGSFKVPTERAAMAPAVDPEPQDEEAAALAEEDAIIQEQEGDEFGIEQENDIAARDEEDSGNEIDDNPENA